MEYIGFLGVIGIVGWIWIVIKAFQDSIGWGVGSLLCGIVALVYGIMNFDRLKVPVILMIIGMVFGGIGNIGAIR